ncbi:hypothetical protein C4D60_Mb03t19900 [Musa balbisiana]|uniref:Uncharacterized protein n=1 Tax=Musa balbisiana TaxID=52838 RepID=A0A4S8JDL8_MUSBA|nr:hypothetical protein C4D60_Mb03t19900 [Musa balbisiana]
MVRAAADATFIASSPIETISSMVRAAADATFIASSPIEDKPLGILEGNVKITSEVLMPSIKSFTLEFNNRDTDTHRIQILVTSNINIFPL